MSDLFKPTVLPGELDHGYMGRVMRLNKVKSEKDLVNAICIELGMEKVSRRELSRLEALSLFSQKPLLEFAQEHSTIPIRRAITSSMPDLRHGCESRRTLLCNFGMVAVRPGAYFCTHCASEEVKKYGVSYWHRDCQIPGHYMCTVHNVELSYVSNSKAFYEAPHECYSNAETIPAEWLEEVQTSQSVSKFLEISAQLFTRDAPLDAKFVSLALRSKAGALNLNTVGIAVKSKKQLSDLILDSFPQKWLATVVPSLVGKVRGKVLNRVDGVLYMANSASTVWSYLTAAAVLYDSAEEAVQDMVNAKQNHDVAYRAKERRSVGIEKPVLLEHYIECNGSHALVAEKLSISIHRTTNLLLKAGLPNLGSMRSVSKNPKAAVEAWHLDERSFEECAMLGGLTSAEMSALIRCHGEDFKQTLLAMGGKKMKNATRIQRTKHLLPKDAGNLIKQACQTDYIQVPQAGLTVPPLPVSAPLSPFAMGRGPDRRIASSPRGGFAAR